MKKKMMVLTAAVAASFMLSACAEGDTLGEIAQEMTQMPGQVSEMSGEEIKDKAKETLDNVGFSEGAVIVDAAGAAVDTAKDAIGEELGDPVYYAMVSAMDKALLEAECIAVRDAYIKGEWDKLADKVSYPIMINGSEIKDTAAFLEYMKDKTVDASDLEAISQENCHDMFINGQGICFGSGQIWMNDMNYMTDKTPDLKIIAISGIE